MPQIRSGVRRATSADWRPDGSRPPTLLLPRLLVAGRGRLGRGRLGVEGQVLQVLLVHLDLPCPVCPKAIEVLVEGDLLLRLSHLAADDLQDYPFVYLTGTGEFELTDREAQSLKRYVASGGFLLASPSGGAPGFDAAFRREIARALGGLELRPLAADHAVYNMLYAIDAVGYADYVARLEEAPPALPLEGISLGGSTPVIYSPYGLGGGWRGFDHPFGRDIAHEDAMKLGINIVLYSMTH